MVILSIPPWSFCPSPMVILSMVNLSMVILSMVILSLPLLVNVLRLTSMISQRPVMKTNSIRLQTTQMDRAPKTTVRIASHHVLNRFRLIQSIISPPKPIDG